MSATLFSEGHDLKAVIAQIDEQHPGAATVVSLSERRSRGVFGLLGRKSYEIEYEVDEPEEELSPIEIARRAHEDYERQTGGKRSPRPMRLAESADKSRHLQTVLGSTADTDATVVTTQAPQASKKKAHPTDEAPVAPTAKQRSAAKTSPPKKATPIAAKTAEPASAATQAASTASTTRPNKGITLTPSGATRPLIGKKSTSATSAKTAGTKSAAAKRAATPKTATEANNASAEIAKALAARKAAQIVAAEGQTLPAATTAPAMKPTSNKRVVVTEQPDFSGTLQAIAAARAAAAARRDTAPARPAGRIVGKPAAADPAIAQKIDGASILESIARAAAQAAEAAAQAEAFAKGAATDKTSGVPVKATIAEPEAAAEDAAVEVTAVEVAEAPVAEPTIVNESMHVADRAPTPMAAPSHIPAEVTESVARERTLQATVLAKALASAYKVQVPETTHAFEAAPQETPVQQTRTRSVRLPQALRISRHAIKTPPANTPATPSAGSEEPTSLADLFEAGSRTDSNKSEVEVDRPASTQHVSAQPFLGQDFGGQDFGGEDAARGALREQARRAIEEAHTQVAPEGKSSSVRGSRRIATYAAPDPTKYGETTRPAGSTTEELRMLGVSEKLIAEVADSDVFAALRGLTSRLRKAPALSTAAGEIVLLAGPLVQTLRAARTLASELRIDNSSIYVISNNSDFSTHGLGVSMDGKALTPMSAASLIRAGITAGIIVIDTDADDTSALTSWSQGDDRSKLSKIDAMIRAMEPQATWLVTDASRKFSDIESDLNMVPLVDALIVHSAAQCTSPATVWGHKLPIALLDGRPSSASAWFALLADRLDQQRQLTATRR